MKNDPQVKKEFVSGTLVGVIDGPLIIIDVRGEERKYNLNFDLTLEWVSSHLDKGIMCIVEDGKVTELL